MKRWQEHLTEWLTVQRVGMILLALSLALGVAGYINQHPEGFNLSAFMGDFYANISAEMASIAITVLIIDSLNRRRDAVNEERREREQLTRQLGSTVNAVAKQASEQLRARGWLTDGTLQEADLRVANLDDARLWQADLQGVNLQWARLEKANLNRAVLVGANLTQAKMKGVKLNGADLRGANLTEARLYRASFYDANLRDADLTRAYLQGARLNNADLRGAILDGSCMDEWTVCPDGANWTPETDLTRFTDPTHPDCWIPAPPSNGDHHHSHDDTTEREKIR